MSLNLIYQFQLKLHQLLLSSEKIREYTKKIYLSIVQDGDYPFILINFLKIDDKSKNAQIMYLVEFEICIFACDKNKKNLLNISNIIDELIISKNLLIHECNVVGVKLNELFFNEAKDMLHSKLTMRYKAIINKEIINEFS